MLNVDRSLCSGCTALLLLFSVVMPSLSQAPAIPGSRDQDRTRRAVGPISSSKGVTSYNWTLTPAGKLLSVGEMPMGAALSPDGSRLVVTNNGTSEHSLTVIDTESWQTLRHIVVPKPYALYLGVVFSPDGHTLFASGGGRHNIRIYDTRRDAWKLQGDIKLGKPSERFFPGSLAITPDGKTLLSANLANGSVAVIDIASRRVRAFVPLGGWPYGIVLSPDGRFAYVSNWDRATISVIDLRKIPRRPENVPPKVRDAVVALVRVGEHPNAMALSRNGRELYVACANSDSVSVIDTKRIRTDEQIIVPTTQPVLSTLSLSPYKNAPSGSSPSALTLSPDGESLYVANGGNNDIVVVKVVGMPNSIEFILPDLTKKPNTTYDPTLLKSGLIPTGWYPTAVCVSPDSGTLYVTSSKGLGPGQNARPRKYIADLLRGLAQKIPVPSAEALDKLTQQVVENNGFDESLALPVPQTATPAPVPVPRRIGDPSVFKHVIYIIKENRTYDQVLGDLPQGNGDPWLCLFDRKVTPNHHALAEEFVLLDNFYVDGQVSADGHEWTVGAQVTDFVERTWPPNYSGRGSVPSGPISTPTAGYLWDYCDRKGLTHFNYGERQMVHAEAPNNFQNQGLPNSSKEYGGWKLGPREDQRRADIFLKDLKAWEEKGVMPNLVLMSLHSDHTEGTAAGRPTPRASVADNDLALGRIVEAVSHSKFWKDTAIFVVEDDAQDGPDHVDAHRTIAFVISPYTKRRVVDSTLYDTCSMVKTIELILGLPPMSQFDAAATPMLSCFTDQPDFTPIKALPATWDLAETNPKTAPGAKKSARMNFKEVDAAPWGELNRIIWASVKGPRVPYPKIVSTRRSLFGEEEDDD